MSRMLYGVGGYDPEKPFDNIAKVHDDATRTVTDYRGKKPVTRPYDDEENRIADLIAAGHLGGGELPKPL